MKQEDLILKLKSLKSVQPNSNILMAIEKDVYSRLEADKGNLVLRRIKSLLNNVSLIFKANPFASYGIAVALVVVIFLSVSTGFLPNEINKTLLYAKIATAPNRYVKASIALSYAQDKLDSGNLKKNIQSPNGIKDISNSIAIANTELSDLRLMGEKGIYTSAQCKDLYRSFHTSLEKLNQSLTASSPYGGDKSTILLKTQIFNYEKLAEQKLNLY